MQLTGVHEQSLSSQTVTMKQKQLVIVRQNRQWTVHWIIYKMFLHFLVGIAVLKKKLNDDTLSSLSNSWNSKWRPRWPPMNSCYIVTFGYGHTTTLTGYFMSNTYMFIIIYHYQYEVECITILNGYFPGKFHRIHTQNTRNRKITLFSQKLFRNNNYERLNHCNQQMYQVIEIIYDTLCFLSMQLLQLCNYVTEVTLHFL